VTSDGDVELREQLRHVVWIGGGSGAGKSTVARRIAADGGLQVYATDDVMADHAARAAPADVPHLRAFMAMDMDERWVDRSPEVMFDTFPWFRGEAFGLIVDDLVRLPAESGVVAEGFRLLPHRVAPLLAATQRAVWLLPTPEFRRAAFEGRDPPRSFVERTGDPEVALRNLLERDRAFTEQLRDEATSLGLRTIDVDTTLTEDELVDRVADVFGT
jgi:hypothetical protein